MRTRSRATYLPHRNTVTAATVVTKVSGHARQATVGGDCLVQRLNQSALFHASYYSRNVSNATSEVREMARKVRQATPFARDGKRLRALRLALAEYLGRPDYALQKGGIENFCKDLDYPSNRYGQFENGVRLITLEAARLLKEKFAASDVDLDFIYDGKTECFGYILEAKVKDILSKL